MARAALFIFAKPNRPGKGCSARPLEDAGYAASHGEKQKRSSALLHATDIQDCNTANCNYVRI